MYLNEKYLRKYLPVYEVKELSLEEALLVLAADKEYGRSDIYFEKSMYCNQYDEQGLSAAMA